MKTTLKRIIVTYDQPMNDGNTGYMVYWNEPDYDFSVQVSDVSVRFWFSYDAQTIDYYEGGRTIENAFQGLEFSNYMHEGYEHCTVAIEFSNGNKVEYKCPEDFNKFVSDFKDFEESDYTCVPGTSDMSRAASLLDDEMQYEI